MKPLAAILLGLGAASAVFFEGYSVWDLIHRLSQESTVSYNNKQIDILNETAKTLIPMLTGFAALAASGAGYLHTHRHIQSRGVKLGIFSIFFTTVLSLGCLIGLLGAVVVCSGAFDHDNKVKLIQELSVQRSRFLQQHYNQAIFLAHTACAAFFFAVDIALLIAMSVFADAKTKIKKA